jgi:hypothetical protein
MVLLEEGYKGDLIVVEVLANGTNFRIDNLEQSIGAAPIRSTAHY